MQTKIAGATISKSRITFSALAFMAVVLTGCGGSGGGHSSSSSPNTDTSIKGVATPSNVSVVTAQNASAGG